MKHAPPVPENEWDRISKMSEFDIDYSDIRVALGDLTRLAAKVAGTEISLINMIDSFKQWTVTNDGLRLAQ